MFERFSNRILRIIGLAMLSITLVACTLRSTGDPAIPSTIISVTEGISTCGDVINAALEQPRCNISDESVQIESDSIICHITAEYEPDNPAENRLSSGYIPRLENIEQVRQISEATHIENGIQWQSYTLRSIKEIGTLHLITIGDVTLSNITPQLDQLMLETSDTQTCSDTFPAALIAQSEQDRQGTFNVNGADITVGTTALITAQPDDDLRIYTLKGLTVVSANGVTRVVRAGERIDIPQTDSTVNDSPQPAVPYAANFISTVPLKALPQPIALNDLPVNVQVQQLQTGNCEVNPQWTDEHVVQRGESLARIAPLYDLTIQELQAGNCLQNPNRLSIGAVLRIPPQPGDSTTANTETTTAPDNAVIIPPSAENDVFTIDALAAIQPGDCTYLRWDTTSLSEEDMQVYLDGQPVSPQNGQEVCPQVTTVYTLRIEHPDGAQESYMQAIIVEAN